MSIETLKQQIKKLLIEELDLRNTSAADIVDDAPLFGGGLGLDSLDALQLVMAIEQRFGVTVPEGEPAKAILASVAAIAHHIERVKAGEPG
ncbi:MAG TPA: phosphopantetheine-binding protein [Polyangiaceae bacterium]